MARKKAGSTREAVDHHIQALEQENQLDTHGVALAAVAKKLADLLDGGEPVLMTGTWARELRSTLVALAPRGGAGGDDDDDSWLTDLSATLRDPAE